MRPEKNLTLPQPEPTSQGLRVRERPKTYLRRGAGSSLSLEPYTIMVAEDFDDTRAVLRRSLEGKGYRVVEAANGLEAVELVRDGCPDLVLMDLNMPLMDGLEATERIRECRELCGDVVILAITAHDTYGMKEAALEAGCDGYITKPIDLERLETILGRLLPTGGGWKLRG